MSCYEPLYSLNDSHVWVGYDEDEYEYDIINMRFVFLGSKDSPQEFNELVEELTAHEVSRGTWTGEYQPIAARFKFLIDDTLHHIKRNYESPNVRMTTPKKIIDKVVEGYKVKIDDAFVADDKAVVECELL